MDKIDEEIAKNLSKIDMLKICKKTNDALRNFCKDMSIKNRKITPLIFASDSKQTTSALTQLISRAFLNIGFDQFEKLGFKFNDDKDTGSGYDVTYKFVQIEIKMTQSNDNWTGNKYSNKVPRHILINYDIDEMGYISGYSLFYLNLNKCIKTEWIKTKSVKAAFSNLKIHIDDLKNIFIISGNLIKKVKWCKVINEKVYGN